MALGLVLAAVMACGALSGADDLEVRALSDGGGDETAQPDMTMISDAAAPPCEAPSSCVAVPQGWQGPFAVAIAQDPEEVLTCVGEQWVRGWQRSGTLPDASISPAECGCSCGPITGSCGVTIHQHDDPGCGKPPVDQVATLGVCNPTASGTDGFRASVILNSPLCPPVVTKFISPLGTEQPIAIGCSPTHPGGCSGSDVCMPKLPMGSRLCVRSEVTPTPACPPQFPQSVELRSGVEDTRGCSPCTCTTTASSCALSYTLFDQAACAGTTEAFTDTACHISRARGASKLTQATLSGTCQPNGGAPIGGVMAQAASSLCCEP